MPDRLRASHCLLALLVLAACGGTTQEDPATSGVATSLSASGGSEAQRDTDAIFTDVADSSGLAFTHWNGMAGDFDYPEMMGSGVALLDYDGDGDLDVYLVQGNALREGREEAAIFAPPSAPPLSDRLFRNDLELDADGRPVLRFTDVTTESGLDGATGYGMGAAAADFDNDGDVDLYVTNLGANQLWRNDGADAEGRVRFTDVTSASGAGERRWSVPAVVADFDRDGWLDLFVGNYVVWSAATNPRCTDELGLDNYCGPLAFRPEPDTLLRNLGSVENLRFEDVSARAGLGAAYGGALGAVTVDFDGDGWLDLYVGNDGMPNQLWHHRGKDAGGALRFADEALLAGAAVSGQGNPEASMGVAAADVDGDGDEDLFLTHLARETNTLYVNDGAGHFDDRSLDSGLGSPSFASTGFGTAFLDYDNDGWLDVFAANGAVRVIKEQRLAGDLLPLRQRHQLFRHRGAAAGGLGFEEVSSVAGDVFEILEVGRGAAFGDLDNDGDTDLILSTNSGPARVLRNEVGQDAAWLGLHLVVPVDGRPDGMVRDAWGARVEAVLVDGRITARRVGGTASYASASDPRIRIGLGMEETAVDEIRVHWPDGRRERFEGIETQRYTTLRQGVGQPIDGGGE